MPPLLQVRHLGRRDYLPVWEAMRRFTATRTPHTPDELWLLEHPPVFTLGQAGKAEHLLDPGPIPVIHCDRGGQVTYHGPGQLVAYLLLDLRRLSLGPRGLVYEVEAGLLDLLASYGLEGQRRPGAPGVYVAGAKVAALGFRIRRGCSYHGLSLNVAMDLGPFQRIHPCGYAGLPVTDLARLGVPRPALELERVAADLSRRLAARWNYVTMEAAPELPASLPDMVDSRTGPHTETSSP